MQNNIRSLFDDIFSRFRKEFSESRMFDRDFEVLDISPFFKQDEAREDPQKRFQGIPPGKKRRGFTIKITRRSNQKPRVDVRTFGNVSKDEVRKGISKAMRSIGPAGPEEIPRPVPRKIPQSPVSGKEVPDQAPPAGPRPAREEKPAKYTEEPKTEIRSLGDRVVVEMELPDVKSESDIRINQLQSSVEVRARAGDKAYFKIITKPEQLSVTSRKFEKGTLRIEFS
jgi:HSP20 family molecular chaperone IbpA